MSEPCKGIQDSLGFWVSRCGFRIQVLDPSFCQWNLDSGFPLLSGIPDSLSRIPIPKPRIPESIGKIFKDSRFHKQKFPGFQTPYSLIWGELCLLSQSFFSLKDPVGYSSIT